MININFQNSTNAKIGSNHGIRPFTLNRFYKKHESGIKTLFKNKKKPGYAFLELPDDMALVSKIKKYAIEQKKKRWENIVVLGIGGSSLGIIAIQEALLGPLNQLNGKPRLFVVDNIDPTYTHAILKTINLKKSLVVVISKSGTTVEPMSLYGIFMEKIKKVSPKTYKNHFVFVTDPKTGVLREIAKKEGIKTFDVPQKVGGRFSVLSAVGLLPAALVGIDIGKLLKGARTIREEIKKQKGDVNSALLLASFQYLLDQKKGKVMTVIMPYSNSLFRMGDWYRQLLAESIGKNSKAGPTPINALGATDQHSQLQLYNEGPNNKFIIFLKVKQFDGDLGIENELPKKIDYLNGKTLGTVMNAAYKGTADSLTHHQRPNLTIEISKINPENIGALFMLLECQVALLGLMHDVNTFNQPGVEKSKQITKQILSK